MLMFSPSICWVEDSNLGPNDRQFLNKHFLNNGAMRNTVLRYAP